MEVPDAPTVGGGDRTRKVAIEFFGYKEHLVTVDLVALPGGDRVARVVLDSLGATSVNKGKKNNLLQLLLGPQKYL